MLTSDDYKLILTLVDDVGQPYQNVFYYKRIGGDPPSADDLAGAFIEDILPALSPVLHDSMEGRDIECYNMMDDTDFTTIPIPTFEGDDTGAYNNNWDAWSFRIIRPQRGLRNGRKAFGRIAEDALVNGEPTLGTLTQLVSLANALGTTISLPAGDATYALCVVRQVEFENPSTGKTYRVPDELYVANGVDFIRASTQNSRKNF